MAETCWNHAQHAGSLAIRRTRYQCEGVHHGTLKTMNHTRLAVRPRKDACSFVVPNSIALERVYLIDRTAANCWMNQVDEMAA